jgi:hypothetical protein
VARRETINDPWQEPVNLGPNVNSSASEIEPSISADGLELYFASLADWNTRVCTRPSKDAPWGSPIVLLELGGAWRPDISADGLSLYFESTRAGGYGAEDIWVTTREKVGDPWGEPVHLGANVNSSGNDYCPSISTDGLTLVFMRGYTSMWATTRKSVVDDWGPAVDLGFNRTNFNGPALSPDGSTIYFDANTNYWGGYGSGDILQVNFIPIVDFNGDGKVDIADLVILIEHWGQEEPSCDIAPLPLGDGRVDVKDLEVLMRYWQQKQEILPPGLVAYWKLDETQGNVAEDSAGDNDGTLSGEPLWQPEGGKVSGALQLDGVDDYLTTPFILNPADGRFSVFAWVKGGVPGQVIVSQIGGADWLCADPSEGRLMTSLVPPAGRNVAQPLVSELVITDDNWHRIGFVWDGSHRRLYVDGVVVAADAQDALAGSVNGLYIGCGKAMEPGTFWFGLIDDVRIYNRAVHP